MACRHSKGSASPSVTMRQVGRAPDASFDSVNWKSYPSSDSERWESCFGGPLEATSHLGMRWSDFRGGHDLAPLQRVSVAQCTIGQVEGASASSDSDSWESYFGGPLEATSHLSMRWIDFRGGQGLAPLQRVSVTQCYHTTGGGRQCEF